MLRHYSRREAAGCESIDVEFKQVRSEGFGRDVRSESYATISARIVGWLMSAPVRKRYTSTEPGGLWSACPL